MKHVKPVSRKPEPAQQTVLQVKLDQLLFYFDASAGFLFGKYGHSIV